MYTYPRLTLNTFPYPAANHPDPGSTALTAFLNTARRVSVSYVCLALGSSHLPTRADLADSFSEIDEQYLL